MSSIRPPNLQLGDKNQIHRQREEERRKGNSFVSVPVLCALELDMNILMHCSLLRHLFNMTPTYVFIAPFYYCVH